MAISRPSNYEDISFKSPIDQACEQVFYVGKDMDIDSKKVGLKRFLNLDYEEICNSPSKAINKVKTFYARTSLESRLISRSGPPKNFRYTTTPKVGQIDYDYIKAYLADLYKY